MEESDHSGDLGGIVIEALREEGYGAEAAGKFASYYDIEKNRPASAAEVPRAEAPTRAPGVLSQVIKLAHEPAQDSRWQRS